MTIIQFAGYLAHQLIVNADDLVSLYSPPSQELRSIINDVATPNAISVETPETESTLTGGENIFLSLRLLIDAKQEEHHQIAYDKTTGRSEQRQDHAHYA